MNFRQSFALLFLATFSVTLFDAKKEPKFTPYLFPGIDLVEARNKYDLKGVKLAFLIGEKGKADKCIPKWNGQDDVDKHNFTATISDFMATGGQVIITFGGADGDYMENFCATPSALAGAYKQALTAINTTHLNLNIEQPIDTEKVTLALAELQEDIPHVTVAFTILADWNGIIDESVDLMHSAVRHGVRVDVVHAVLQNFEQQVSNRTWSEIIDQALEHTHRQLMSVWTQKTLQEVRDMTGVTVVLGVNTRGDQPFLLDSARYLVDRAKAKGIGHLSFWSLLRDNDGCPDEKVAKVDCSGLNQTDHEFTKIFSEFNE